MEKLKAIRKAKGVTQVQLAKRLKCKQPNVSAWEIGEVVPSHETLTRIARVLGCKPADLV